MNLPDIVCITETWCSSDEIQLIQLQSYQLAGAYCRTNLRGGGVAIFALNNLKCKTINKFSNLTAEQHFEVSVCEILLEGISLVICSLYRSPTGDFNLFFNSLSDLLSESLEAESVVCFCGDFNVRFNDVTCKNSTIIENLFLSFGLNKTIFDFTRIHNHSKTTLDNIFTNIATGSLDSRVIYCDISDHFMQEISLFLIQSETEESPIYKQFFYREKNVNRFKLEVSKTDWSSLESAGNLNEAFAIFFNIITENIKLCFPLERLKPLNNVNGKPWLTREIIEEGRALREIHKMCKFSDDPPMRLHYNALKSQHSKQISLAKKTYHNNLFINSKNRSRTAWKP